MERKCAVVSVGVGGRYPEGVDRLEKSLDQVGFSGLRWLYRDDYPPQSPTHQQSPYEFKLHAIREAQRQGAELVLWLDASCWAVRPLAPIFERLARDGAWIIGDAWTVGQWSTDECLAWHSLRREEAHRIPLNYAIGFGLDVAGAKSQAFLSGMADAAKAGCFRGPWRHPEHTRAYRESLPLMPTSLPQIWPGHRHDQTCASILIARLGLPYGNAAEQFAVWRNGARPDTPPFDQAIIVAQGI